MWELLQNIGTAPAYLKKPPESTDRSSFTSSTYRMDLSISSSACAHTHH
jgi:hypothetical protein